MDLGVDRRELRAPELDLALCWGAAAHSGIDPEVCQVVSRLFVDGPSAEATRLEPLAELSEETARSVPGRRRQVHIAMTAGHILNISDEEASAPRGPE